MFGFWGATGALKFARTEGIIPAPEPTHAIAAAIREALKCKETGEAKVIVTALCGHGHFDLASYDNFLSGGLVDLEYPEAKVREMMARVPKVGWPWRLGGVVKDLEGGIKDFWKLRGG